ncbi:hypothetical protein PEX2_031500 [Penicillium expansum]|uniref:Zinc finger, C2H2 n=1 Tax=Penicillium expansum TaxID=27334 RepID=A0A0A2J220_PENEN|nr:hypothetical protein PEX2_031500 [Penicillium expansum]KGO49379.1 hypothetical protein PEX2_031500 [Penicillium expansum]
MVKKSSPQFSCPGCERTNFRSLVGVRNHFIIKRHSFQCHICERIFHDELAIIQHYQKYTKSSSPGIPKDVQRALSPGIPSPNIPSPSVPSPSVPSPSVPSPSVLSPSVPSSTALVTPAVRSIAVQTDAPEEPSKLSEQKPKITDGHLSDTLLASMTAITFKNGSLLGKEPQIYPLSKPRLISI